MKKYVSFLLLFFVAVTAYATLPAEGEQLKIMSYNVRNGKGMDDVTDYSRAAGVINNFGADVVAVQELDSVTGRSGGVMVLDTLAALTGMHSVYAKAIDFDGGGYGIGILSREKPVSVQRIPLPAREEERVLLVAEFDGYVFMSTHFSLTAEDRAESVRIINSVSEQYKKPVFLAGDLNAEPDSPEIAALSEKFRMLSDTTLCTYPADNPQECIDYIMVSRKGGKKIVLSGSGVTVALEESDHRPVYVELRLK